MPVLRHLSQAVFKQIGYRLFLCPLKNNKNISTHLLTVAVDFCLTLTDVVEPINTRFCGICYFYVGVFGGVNECGIGVVV